MKLISVPSLQRSEGGSSVCEPMNCRHISDMARTGKSLESNVVELETSARSRRKMFPQELLAVRLGQAKTGHSVNVSARFSGFHARFSSHIVPAFLDFIVMPHTMPECAAASLKLCVSRGTLFPLSSVETTEADAMKRGSQE